MKAPQRGHPVKCAMHAVLHEVGRHHELDHLQPDGLRRHGTRGPFQRRERRERRCRPERQESQQLHADVVDEEVGEVRAPAGPQHALRRPEGKHPLERYEDHREDQQVQQEPVEPEVYAAVEVSADLDSGPAEDDGDARQREPHEAERLALAQQEAQAGRQEGEADQQLDERTHERQRVPRAQVRRGQEVREVKHEHGACRCSAQENADDAADPPRTDGTRGCVGEEATQPAFESRGLRD